MTLVGSALPADRTGKEALRPPINDGVDSALPGKGAAGAAATTTSPATNIGDPLKAWMVPEALAEDEEPSEPSVAPPQPFPEGSEVGGATMRRGLATWYGGADGYGPEDTMADGSPFDPNNPTIAAANGWPLGTWLKVCHQGACIDVQVRDRGAFSHAIDLSRAAFGLLAPPGGGVIEVTVQELVGP